MWYYAGCDVVFDVAIIGGGVIGLLSTLQLALAGQRVLLLDKAELGQEASWAGGGIVSPLYPWRYSAAVTALAHWSQDFYPMLGSQLLEKTGLDPEVHVTGLYWLDLEDEVEAFSWAESRQRPLASVPIGEVYSHIPVLGAEFKKAIYMPDVANVRNPRLVKSLQAALVAMPNVTLKTGSEVQAFLQEGDAITGVYVDGIAIQAERVVVSAGAWSGSLLASVGIHLPVEPVKGQMMLFKCADDFLSSMVLAKGRYAIPRRDGHILVGSTLEHVGFDKKPTKAAHETLLSSAVELLPALENSQVVAQWAGLRPGSPEGIPYIGPVSAKPGLWLNCGHYRNGLVLAPASCRLLADLMTGEVPIINPAPYLPDSRLEIGYL
jgi:glycine oxidase